MQIEGAAQFKKALNFVHVLVGVHTLPKNRFRAIEGLSRELEFIRATPLQIFDQGFETCI